MMCCIKVARPRRRPHAKQGERLMPKYVGLSVLGRCVPIPLACAPGGSAPPSMWKRPSESNKPAAARTWRCGWKKR